MAAVSGSPRSSTPTWRSVGPGWASDVQPVTSIAGRHSPQGLFLNRHRSELSSFAGPKAVKRIAHRNVRALVVSNRRLAGRRLCVRGVVPAALGEQYPVARRRARCCPRLGLALLHAIVLGGLSGSGCRVRPAHTLTRQPCEQVHKVARSRDRRVDHEVVDIVAGGAVEGSAAGDEPQLGLRLAKSEHLVGQLGLGILP